MIDRFKGHKDPEIREMKPRFQPSLPPKDICNSHLFTYVADNRDPHNPKRVLYMEQENEAYSHMMTTLNNLAARAKEYEKFPMDDPRRISFEYRRWILAYLFTSTGNGILNLDEFEEMIKKWVSPAYFKTEMIKVKNQETTVTTPIGKECLNEAIATVIDHDLQITPSASYLERYIKKPLPK